MVTLQGSQLCVVKLEVLVAVVVDLLVVLDSVILCLAVQKPHERSQWPAKMQVRQKRAWQTSLGQSAPMHDVSQNVSFAKFTLSQAVSVVVNVLSVVVLVTDIDEKDVTVEVPLVENSELLLLVLDSVAVESVVVSVVELVHRHGLLTLKAQNLQVVSHRCAPGQVGQKASAHVAAIRGQVTRQSSNV